MKAKKIPLSVLFITGIVLVLINVGLYKRSKVQAPNKSLLYCKDFDTVTDLIKSNLRGKHQTTVRVNPVDQNNIGFYWRRDSKEPMVSYPAQKHTTLYLYGQPSSESSNHFAENISPLLRRAGFVFDNKNYIQYAENGVTVGGNASYGFLKGKDYYVISVDGSYAEDVSFNKDGTTVQIPLPENSSGIDIICGVTSPAYDDLYDRVVGKKVYTTKDRIGLVETKDNVAYFNVGQIGSFGSSSSYWLIANNSVEQLVKGTQEAPLCDIFESRKVGKGIGCYDTKTQTQRTVAY
jgi:hypothetical protein